MTRQLLKVKMWSSQRRSAGSPLPWCTGRFYGPVSSPQTRRSCCLSLKSPLVPALESTLTATFCRLRLKDRVPVKTAGRFALRQTDDGTLEIRISSAQRSDAGVYVCRIINDYGTRQQECRVDVRGERQRRLGWSASSPFILLG